MELCEECKKKGYYRKVVKGGGNNVILINYSKSSHYYQPDIYAYTSKGQVDIYEVLDTEEVNAGIADLILSILTPNVRLIHMACWDQKTAEKLKNLAKIIEGKLKFEDGENLLARNKYYIEDIPEGKDLNKIKKILWKKLKFCYSITKPGSRKRI